MENKPNIEVGNVKADPSKDMGEAKWSEFVAILENASDMDVHKMFRACGLEITYRGQQGKEDNLACRCGIAVSVSEDTAIMIASGHYRSMAKAAFQTIVKNSDAINHETEEDEKPKPKLN